ncbi:hypothetical protein KY334_03790 [Candidatus Woesearchaeota archaeon]|nr:hypothetical protein [Candidatus Woesearchaeota archaeon]
MINKKGQGIPESFIDLLAYITWVFLIMAAIFFLSIGSCSSSQQVKVSDLNSGSKAAEVDLILSYLQTPVDKLNCNNTKVLDNKTMVQILDKKLTFNELINLALRAEPERNEHVGYYANLWKDIPKSYLKNPEYEAYLRLLMVCTDEYFVDKFGEHNEFSYDNYFSYDFVLKDEKTILDLDIYKYQYPDKYYTFVDVYSDTYSDLKLHISKKFKEAVI